MSFLKISVILLLACAIPSISGCFLLNQDITIIDAKTVAGVDERLSPLRATDKFSKETAKVSCWFKWRNAKINTEILTKWRYITDDIHIADHPFIVPKKEGMGSVELAMPYGKTLPPGSYKVDIALGRRILKTLSFKVE